MPVRIDITAPEPDRTPRPERPPLLRREIALFGTGTGTAFRIHFYMEMSVLLSAGMDLYRTLRMMEAGSVKHTHRQLTGQIAENVLLGASLSKALQRTGRFSAYEIWSIRIGEETGRLDHVLNELTLYFSRSARYRQQLKAAITYPVFVLGFSLLVLVFMLQYLVPMFSDVYQRFGGSLPGITVRIIELSDWCREYLVYAITGLAMTTWGIYLSRYTQISRKTRAGIILRIPLFGGIVRQLILARLCQSLGFLLSAGVPLLQAVGLVKKMIRFYPLERSLEETEHAILHGSSLHAAMSKYAFYPPQMIALLKAGENSGQLDRMLDRLSRQYSEQAERKTALTGSLLEPVLILGVGAIVAVLLIAMYLPLFRMGTVTGG